MPRPIAIKDRRRSNRGCRKVPRRANSPSPVWPVRKARPGCRRLLCPVSRCADRRALKPARVRARYLGWRRKAARRALQVRPVLDLPAQQVDPAKRRCLANRARPEPKVVRKRRFSAVSRCAVRPAQVLSVRARYLGWPHKTARKAPRVRPVLDQVALRAGPVRRRCQVNQCRAGHHRAARKPRLCPVSRCADRRALKPARVRALCRGCSRRAARKVRRAPRAPRAAKALALRADRGKPPCPVNQCKAAHNKVVRKPRSFPANRCVARRALKVFRAKRPFRGWRRKAVRKGLLALLALPVSR